MDKSEVCLNSPLDKKKWDVSELRNGALIFGALGMFFLWLVLGVVPPDFWVWRLILAFLSGFWFLMAVLLFMNWRQAFRERNLVFNTVEPIPMRLTIAGDKAANYALEVRTGKRPYARIASRVLGVLFFALEVVTLSGVSVSTPKSYVCTGYLFLPDETHHQPEHWEKEASHTVKLNLPDKVALAINTDGVVVDLYLHPESKKPFAFLFDDELYYPQV